MSDANIELNLGSLRLVVKPDDITVKKSKELRASSTETIEQFQQQINDLRDKINEIFDRFETQLKKLDDESDDNYDTRSKSVLEEQQKELDSVDRGDDIYTLMQKLLKVVANAFNQGEKISNETFDLVSIPKLEIFLFTVFNKAKIPAVAEIFNPNPKKV